MTRPSVEQLVKAWYEADMDNRSLDASGLTALVQAIERLARTIEGEAFKEAAALARHYVNQALPMREGIARDIERRAQEARGG